MTDEFDKNLKELTNLCLEQMIEGVAKKFIEMWKRSRKQALKEVLEEIEEMDIELVFATYIKDMKTNEKIDVPKEISFMLDKYWLHIQNRLKQKIKEKIAK